LLYRNCGPFIWLNLNPYLKTQTWEAERALVQIMIDHGVWIATGESFKSEVPGWFRITFAVPEQEFVFGVERYVVTLLCSLSIVKVYRGEEEWRDR
jgi:1-aminocyclopropane-1-carboxylate synthase